MSVSLRVQGHIIQPDVVRLLGVIAVHLEGHVDLIRVPIRLRRVIGIDFVSLTVHLQRDVVHLIARAVQSPDNVNSGIGWEMRAWHTRRPHRQSGFLAASIS